MTLRVSIAARLGEFNLNVDFSAPKGVTVLFGPSGCGKSSVIKAVAGLICPGQGQIICADRPLFDSNARLNLPPHRRRLGVIFQDARLFPHLSVRQNLVYGRWFAPPAARGPRFADVVDLLGISHVLHRPTAALSGGEAARVAIGRALLSAPDMILADEPLAALDEARRSEILPYFAALRDADLVPILYVSHSSAEVARLASTVIAMQQGRVVAQGSAAAILGRADVMGAGASTLLPARLVRQHEDGLSELDSPAGPIFVPKVQVELGAALVLRIYAQDVMLACQRPQGVSALNVLRGQIADLHDAPPNDAQHSAVMVSLRIGGCILTALITARSARAMQLRIGQDCFAIVKSAVLEAPTRP